MGRKLAAYGGGLIALYLIVRNATGSGQVLSAGANGSSSIIKAFQGR